MLPGSHGKAETGPSCQASQVGPSEGWEGRRRTSGSAFLQDEQSAQAPLEQRIDFLKSKGLTQEEVDVSLARAGLAAPASNVAYRQPPQQYQQPYYNQGYPPQWPPPQPPQPQRDWRDYFIAANVMGIVGYAMYWTAKRYVYPLIAPPTPPQLEADKKSMDDSFEKAFALLDQLSTDTRELKEAESERKSRLDAALGEVEAVVSRMKQANEDREMESKRIARELAEVRDSIPRALEKEREQQDGRLKDLVTEMKSLKTLVGNRMQGGGAPPSQSRIPPSYSSQPPTNGHVLGSGGPVNGVSAGQQSAPVPEQPARAETTSSTSNGSSTTSSQSSNNSMSAFSATSTQERSQTPYSRLLGGKAAIPSWQLAAKKKTEEAKAESGASTPVTAAVESGTVVDVVDGQS
ncbi:uncharacterized protein MYCFIDRAFT_213380 [Pseudocercospora fijiensis CIRAD86]|uniref:Peroxisomal membrane protein PEX14 n=1 Tax=Pseudocercospora fijiensis (strain CIRAD86) TaxID=383855 RepID=N1QA91_PSEFD|nr:uncharacterized protein MYCFIDRAFT_213380 [Pseudocercospora fijiensis CIRAD86]EME88701.1 hypothetical protein MYCFIDRAFT_213380 [Pseudocercospora fijiensis CIRAD86]